MLSTEELPSRARKQKRKATRKEGKLHQLQLALAAANEISSKKKRKEDEKQADNVPEDVVAEMDVHPNSESFEGIESSIAVRAEEADIFPIEETSENVSKVKAPPILHWMREPIPVSEENVPLFDVAELDTRLQASLIKAGFSSMFPVQKSVWDHSVGPQAQGRDLCVCAPTGSGKTLAYALPILQGLSRRVVRRLRALIVLPTRDLAVQVKAVFDTLAPSLGITVGLAIGQTSLAAESLQLVDHGELSNPLSLYSHFCSQSRLQHGSLIDILVATPGRLMDHLTQTKGFTLDHLKYLVVDEADRLLRQSYQEWLPRVLAAMDSKVAASGVPFWGERGITQPGVTKLIVSATITQDPSKLHRLNLHRPMFISGNVSTPAGQRYRIPSQLQEFQLICSRGDKPLYLVALLLEFEGKEEQSLVFTSSVEATHRLALLLRSFREQDLKIVEYSSWQNQRQRSAALQQFRDGEARVLVASDAMTRGMDIECVNNVVSYDVPVYAKTYVHRVGRTARAGKSGKAFTLLKNEEVHHFKELLRKADHSVCKRHRVKKSVLEYLTPQYPAALELLKVEVEKEEAVAHNKKNH